jgi:protein TonB
LNGSPCRIEFFKIENIDEWSLVETPSPSNQYSRIVVRVRPKDAKRPLRFAVNWKSVTNDTTSSSGEASKDFAEAVPTYKARPEYPAAARSSKTLGTVSVNVTIDQMGNVVSAKATDGPVVLRQSAENAARRWRFRPATRDGKPVSTMQIIRFNFEK